MNVIQLGILWDRSLLFLGMYSDHQAAAAWSNVRTPLEEPDSQRNEAAQSPSCPAMDEAWISRIAKSLARVPKLSTPEDLDRGMKSFPEGGRLLRFVKSEGNTYIAFDGNGHFTVRGITARLQWSRLVAKFPGLPDFDIVVNTHDWPACFQGFHSPPSSALVAFSYSSFTLPLDQGAAGPQPGCLDIPFPDFTEYGWPESAKPSVLVDPLKFLNSTWRADLRRTAAERPFDQRIAQLLFRGSSQRFGHARTKYKENLASPRYPVNRTLLDIQFDSAFMSIFDLSRYKYLLHLPGNGYSSRLKYLFYSDSLVFRDRRDRWVEWWSSGLVANVHYVFVTSTSHASNKTQWAIDHPEQVEAIRKQARVYIDSLPHPDVYLCHLVEQYTRQVQGYTPRALGDAVDLASSLVDPYYPRITHGPLSNASSTVYHMRP